jgi:SPP1 gp7 family putative phage head morphogenesis protein
VGGEAHHSLAVRFSLATLTRRARNPRRKSIPLRTISPPATFATDLYRQAYLPVVQLWAGAEARIMAEYERTLAQITADSAADVQGVLDIFERELTRLYLEITPRLRDWLLRFERYHRGKWRGAVLSATSVDLQTMIGPQDVAETLETVLARNVALVRDVGEQAQGRISDAVFRGLTNRTPARDVARDIRAAVDMSRRRSINIASDQLSKASSALDGERMRQAGIDAWLWKHGGKKHFRPHHKARDGNRYTWTDHPEEMPGELPFCSCRKFAVVEFD